MTDKLNKFKLMYSPLLSYHSVALPKTLNGITKKRNLTDFTNYVEKRGFQSSYRNMRDIAETSVIQFFSKQNIKF